MIPAIIFDFDNTIAATDSIKEIRETGAYERLTAETLRGVVAYNPVPALLQAIRASGTRLAIVTNAGAGYVGPVLAHLGLQNSFDAIVTYTDVKAEGKKPSNKGILLALAKLGIDPSPEILYVGDDNHDHVAAYRAGITPVMPSWATRKPVSVAPAIEMSSTQLLDYLYDPAEYKLFAERAAETGAANYQRKGVYFLPLDDSANVVTVKEEMTAFCLGRYFSQKGAVTSWLHERHALSREIQRKEDEDSFEIPAHWYDLLVHAIRYGAAFVFEQQSRFDVVTIIPSKQGKEPRLERLIDGIAQRMQSDATRPEFIPDAFFFVPDAQSQKYLPRNERSFEANRALQPTGRVSALAGKRVLVIDDVTTTGSTLTRARALALSAGAKSVYGLALAKTVSIMEDERPCPQCGRSMRVKRNSRTGDHFWGCSGFNSPLSPCDHSEPLVKKQCPLCGRDMRVNLNRRTSEKFWSCTGWNQTPACNHSMNMDNDDRPQ